MYEIQDGVAVIELNRPPVNAMGLELRRSMWQALHAAHADGGVQAIVLAGQPRVFSAGADVTEFGTDLAMQSPTLFELIDAIENSPKPVVAAIEGLALGGALELALACQARVAHAQARVGLPEIALGLIPGAGGTQRLSRLIGLEAAYPLMATGQPQPASKLAQTELFDQVEQGDVVAAACARARTLSARPPAEAHAPLRTHRRLDAQSVQSFVAAQRERLTPKQRLQPAYGVLLDVLVGTAESFDVGLKQERDAFMSLMGTRASKALRDQFKAERAASKLPADMQADPRQVDTVAVIGAGTMGTGIAIALLDAGLTVRVLEQDEAALARGMARIAQYYADRVKAGKLADARAQDNTARLASSLDWHTLAEADLVIEAVFEDLAVKQAVFKQIDAHARAGAVLATNTSYLDIDAIAASTQRAQDVLGLHFFSPAQVMKLLEVVQGARTAPDVMATGMALGARMKKVAVPCGNAFGFIGNRIYNAYRQQCEFMLEDGAWPEDVDRALTQFGFAMGPFAVADLSGLDIAWRMRAAQAATRDPRSRYVSILDTLCEQGRMGRKTGAGYYTYPEGKQAAASDAVVRQIITDASAARGIERRTLSADEIVRRAMLALVNEAACLMQQGVAARASDIDVVFVQGYGFPKWEGGPVFWARQQDRAQLEADLDDLGRQVGHGFVRGDVAALLQV